MQRKPMISRRCLDLGKDCGTRNGYAQLGCRGPACEEANRDYAPAKRAIWIANRARAIATKWLREERPKLWAAFKDQAEREWEHRERAAT